MLSFELVTWWYGQGWVSIWQGTAHTVDNISRMFSVPILLRTLFAPWRQIITTPGAGLDDKMHALADNAVSRAVGFVVRLLALVTALIMIAVAAVAGILAAVLWPLVPLAVIALVVKGVIG